VLIVLVCAGVLVGCNTSGDIEAVEDFDQPPAEADALSAGDTAFGGSLLSQVLNGLVSGASGQVGKEAMGVILQLLGWGGGSDDSAALKEMDTRLDEIESTLTEIQGELQDLEQQLDITEDEILASTNDPSDAITEIGTYTDELSGMSDSVKAGKGNRTKILEFANEVQDDFRIENDVNLIHDAILPPTVAKKPVLDNYTDLAIKRVTQHGADVNQAYLGLEQYFTQLVYHQTRGVDLVVEAKLADPAAGKPVNGTGAKAYLSRFRTNSLADEVQNFMDNTWRLVLTGVDLSHTEGFLPVEAQEVVSRAEFLRTQVLLMDHFGLRAHMVQTAEAAVLNNNVVAVDADSQMYLGDTMSSTVSGPVYDLWSQSTVSPSTDYQIVTYDFASVALGDCTVRSQTGEPVYGTAAVQRYDPDYTIDDAGTITYGSMNCATRIGAYEAFTENAPAGTYVDPGNTRVMCSGTPAKGFVEVSGSQSNVDYNGTNEMCFAFTYGGRQTVKSMVTYACDATGSAATSAMDDVSGDADAEIEYQIGVYDTTAGKDAMTRITAKKSLADNDSQSIDDHKQGTLSFTAQPGHAYFVFFAASVSGDSYRGSSRADMKISNIGNLSISFGQ
jgi:hypothetical protein